MTQDRNPQITLDGRRLAEEVVLVHTILGVTFDSELNWKRHITDVRERAIIKLNILKCSASKHWGAELPHTRTSNGSIR
jgi:hypothetical protein